MAARVRGPIWPSAGPGSWPRTERERWISAAVAGWMEGPARGGVGLVALVVATRFGAAAASTAKGAKRASAWAWSTPWGPRAAASRTRSLAARMSPRDAATLK